MARPRLCKLCRQRPAAVPDRESNSLTHRKLICRECHTLRLAGDMREIAERAAQPSSQEIVWRGE